MGTLKPENLLFFRQKSILKMSRHHNFCFFAFFRQLPIQSSKNGFGIISISVIKHLENCFERHLVDLVADMRGKMYKAKMWCRDIFIFFAFSSEISNLIMVKWIWYYFHLAFEKLFEKFLIHFMADSSWKRINQKTWCQDIFLFRLFFINF